LLGVIVNFTSVGATRDMLLSHVAEAEEFISTPYTAVIAQLQIHTVLPVDVCEQLTLSQKAHALRHADQYVSKGDVFDVHLRATVKSGGVFLKLSNGRGWVSEKTPLGEKLAAEATLNEDSKVYRVLAESLRIRKSASRTDVALSTRLTKFDGSGTRALELVYADCFEASGSVMVRGDTYIRLKDGRGYVLATDGSDPLVLSVEPQMGTWMYKVTYEGGIGLRHVASSGSTHRVAPSDADRTHPANIAQGTAVECDMRLLKRINGQLVAFARVSNGGGWLFSHNGEQSLLELIAWDYAGPANETAALEVELAADAHVAPASVEESEARATEPEQQQAEGGGASDPPVSAPPVSAPPLPPPEAPAARMPLAPTGYNGRVNTVLIAPSPTKELKTLEQVKIASANLYAANAYSAATDSDTIEVDNAVSTLNRLWAVASA